MPDPKFVAETDKLHAASKQLLDGYVEAIEGDMNRYVEKHGRPMDDTFAHHDLTRILKKDVPDGMLAGMCAEAILERIARKRRGRS